MANPIQSLNENFSYNSMLVRALMQIMPARDREFIHPWLQLLHEMHDNPEEMTIRNEYMWFLLLQLQNKNIVEPFNQPPSSRRLLPLKHILPEHIYEDVVTSSERKMSQLEAEPPPGHEHPKAKPKQEGFSAPPSQFLRNQPVPENGIICYMAAFSDQS